MGHEMRIPHRPALTARRSALFALLLAARLVVAFTPLRPPVRLTIVRPSLTLRCGRLRAAREMWARLPTFFYSRTLPRDNMNDELEHVVSEGLDGVGYDLVELRTGGTRS